MLGFLPIVITHIADYQTIARLKIFANDETIIPFSRLLRKTMLGNPYFFACKSTHFSQISQVFPRKNTFAKKKIDSRNMANCIYASK